MSRTVTVKRGTFAPDRPALQTVATKGRKPQTVAAYYARKGGFAVLPQNKAAS